MMEQWGSLGRSSDDVTALWLDAALAITLLFVVVVVPPFVGVRMMYTLCWLLFTALALVSASEAARGIATSMGITVMVGWYALRVYDRSAFTAALHGWVGLWATSPVVGFVARVGDFLVHLLLPMLLISCFLPLVRVWMSIPALLSSRLWVHFVVGGGVVPKGDHIFRFSPPRSQHFWNAAYRIELLLNSCVPLFCVLAHQRSFWVYAVTAFCGVLLIGLHLIRSYSLRKLRRNAKEIMSRLLAGGGLHISTDFIVRADAIWLDWMRDGLVAIGETYVGGLWEAAAGRTLDEIVTALMTIPMETRQEMYRSWSARLVALAARVFNYPPSSRGLVVGSAAEQFELSPQFRHEYMDPYLHNGFGIWMSDARTLEQAMRNKLEDTFEKLGLQEDDRVLDLCLGSMGGVGVYLAEHRSRVNVVSVLRSVSERVHAMRFADEKGVSDRIEFIIADSPDKLLTVLSSMSASRFERIVGSGLVESLRPLQLPRLFRTIKRIQAPSGQTLIDFVACPAARSTTHVWNNQYINGAFAVQAVTLHRVRDLLDLSGFTVHEIASYNEHYERTFVEWYRRFHARWGNSNELRTRKVSDGPGRRPRASSAMQSSHLPSEENNNETRALQRARQSLPESFRRTWEFYLLHSAACYRAHVLQTYQLRVA